MKRGVDRALNNAGSMAWKCVHGRTNDVERGFQQCRYNTHRVT